MATKNIEPNLRLISEYTKLGKDDKFRIPEYQRGYSWTIVHCDKLWQDIESFIDSGADDFSATTKSPSITHQRRAECNET